MTETEKEEMIQLLIEALDLSYEAEGIYFLDESKQPRLFELLDEYSKLMAEKK